MALLRPSFYGVCRAELLTWLLPRSTSAATAESRLQKIFFQVYRRHGDVRLTRDIERKILEELSETWSFELPQILTRETAEDGTAKFLFRLEDGETIETVLLPRYRKSKLGIQTNLDRWTVCISSQVGCAMQCAFCLTGVQGLKRNLKAHEIVSQVVALKRLVNVRNLVFMGMGEPLHNQVELELALSILLDPYGLTISRKNIVVSTSGLVSKVRPFVENTKIRMAFSLNAPNDTIRSAIMPVNNKWGIDALLDAAADSVRISGLVILLEYVLLGGINDSLEHAEELRKRVSQKLSRNQALLNLIPFNPFPGSQFERPDFETVKAFQNHLIRGRIMTTVRYSGGQDVLAACGQLRSAVPVTEPIGLS